MSCDIPYIPERLHANGRERVNHFAVGETLFRRCKQEQKSNPFDHFSLYDISVNRRGFNENNLFSEPEDVLFNYNLAKGFERFEESFICMEIKELNSNRQYLKDSPDNLPTNDKLVIFLNHRVEPCNYSHCCFEIFYNNLEMKSKDIYEKNLKKNSVLKTWCKNEISKMLITGEVRLSW